MNTILHGDALTMLKTLPDNYVHSIVCDPPAGINFMREKFDSDRGGRAQWVAWLSEIMGEALRVLRPGGHALVWAFPRTSHWTMCALDDAGFEIRDVVFHLFSSGFPKSLDISKAIDKQAGAERVVVGRNQYASRRPNPMQGTTYNYNVGAYDISANLEITEPATPNAQRWNGWQSALKPACEEWILCRKSLVERTIAANVLQWSCGGINVDACRIPALDSQLAETVQHAGRRYNNVYGEDSRDRAGSEPHINGRWPAHLLISHAEECQGGQCVEGCPALELDRQSGIRKSRMMPPGQTRKSSRGKGGYCGNFPDIASLQGTYGDEGGASRFFSQFYYCPKASQSDRSDGGKVENIHPTVKSTQLMRWLCRLVTPPGGIVLDPFAGSGSTGVAAVEEGFRFVGIELDPEYAKIATARLQLALSKPVQEELWDKQKERD